MTRDEIVSWLICDDPSPLYQRADAVRKEFCGDAIHKRAIIEFSNCCERDCHYCGIRRGNFGLTRYRMEDSQIFAAAQAAAALGYRTLVLQSGEDRYDATDRICFLIRNIKKMTNCAITLCVGERTGEEYRAMREAGADRYLLKFETSDRDLFRALRPGSSYDERINCLRRLRELDYQVGSGCMVGLPGQTPETLADDILLMKEFDFDMIGIGPFIPHPDTPLQNSSGGSLEMTLRMIALARIVTRNAHLPATTAIGSIHPQGRQMALRCGANVIMPNFTPQEFRAHYQIYPNKICINDRPADCAVCVDGMIRSLGRTVATDPGHSLKRGGRGIAQTACKSGEGSYNKRKAG
ncbi:MAG TPA: [FeFe] hydrogenase H-cluster radical SAM maturase HydE [Candidatus Omnitrophota bacterium]|nr:[FeFe] hydrogenase H-cluster radical SAM maturase HydE [Candidatus Omnitrophota bacterium]